MRGASADSQLQLVDSLESAVAAGADGSRLADDLFGVASLLRTEPSLRRVLTDVSLPADAKARLVAQVFGTKLDEYSLRIVTDAAGRRWAGTRDLGDALEHLGVIAVVKAAEQVGEGDRLEDDLFAFGRLVTENPGLRDALSDPSRSSEDKRLLVRGLLEGRVSDGGMRLAEQSTSGFHRNVAIAVDSYQKIAGEQRQRLVALVHVARPLREEESDRLIRTLTEQYGRPVHLNEVVDRGVIGGVRVEIGDDVIDGTVAGRLDDARRRLAG
jgi:F-type H+-transporting ATPase subunit delta